MRYYFINLNKVKKYSSYGCHMIVCCIFTFYRTEDGIILSEITEIELWRDDAGLGSDWFCDVIFLLDLEAGLLIITK